MRYASSTRTCRCSKLEPADLASSAEWINVDCANDGVDSAQLLHLLTVVQCALCGDEEVGILAAIWNKGQLSQYDSEHENIQ